MAKKKALTELTDEELFESLSEKKEALFNLRFQYATGQLDNHAGLKNMKKEVARALTELRHREIAAAEALEFAAEES